MYIYSSEQIKQVDFQAEAQGFSLFALMENAGHNIAKAMMKKIEKNDTLVILAGRGNNGGDGIVLARYLKNAGYNVYLCFPLGQPKTQVAQAHLDYYEVNFSCTDLAFIPDQPTVIIDALLGVGTTLPLSDEIKKVVTWANALQARRYAVDIPTGLAANSGALEQSENELDAIVFQADITFTLHGAKPSAFSLPSSAFYGDIQAISIGLSHDSSIKVTSKVEVRHSLAKRQQADHKGSFGMSLLFAGSDHMPGSALLAAIGAIRSGTGRLMIGTSAFVSSIIATQVPEATYMKDGIYTLNHTKEIPHNITAIGIGPGLEDFAAIDDALDFLLQTDIPLVLDAGALYKNRSWKRDAITVLTPHPGEFSVLTGMSIQSIQENRIEIAQNFALNHEVILVLKGHHTVIAFPNGTVRVNPTGNTALSKGGTGDVLTGMITSMLSYDKNPYSAIVNAVYLHGYCAELWTETNGEATMTASDFHTLLPKAFYHIQEE